MYSIDMILHKYANLVLLVGKNQDNFVINVSDENSSYHFNQNIKFFMWLKLSRENPKIKCEGFHFKCTLLV